MKKTLLLFTLLLVGALSLSAQSLGNGLVARYNFNGNADDVSGNNFHGTVNGPVLTTDRWGNPNGAYEFDGVDDYIDFPSDTALRLSEGSSVSLWLNLDAYGGLFNLEFVLGTYYGFGMGLTQNGNFSFGLGDGSGDGPGSRRTFTSDSIIPTGSWNHIVAIYRSYDDMTLCLNGVPVTGSYSGSGDTLMAHNSSAFPRLGQSANDDNISFTDGKIDDIRLYDRDLSVQECALLYSDEVLSINPSQAGDLMAAIGPNPTVEAASLHLGQDLHRFELKVQNAAGQQVMEMSREYVPQGAILPLRAEQLSAGVYFVSLQAEEGHTVLKWIVRGN